MEMLVYNVVGFFRSRHGRVVGGFLLILMGAFIFKSYRGRANVEAEPKKEPSSIWQDSGGILGEEREEITIKKSFNEFNPGKPKQDLIVIEKTKPKRSKIRSPETFKPLPPLILSQAASSEPAPASMAREIVNQPPTVKSGLLLHCQLLNPVASNELGMPIVAQLIQPLIQEGKIIASAGSEVFGTVSQYQGGRIYFETAWTVAIADGSLVSFTGNAQERAYNGVDDLYGLSDGRLGLPAPIAEKKQNIWKAGLGTVLSTAGRLAQSRVRTVVGEQVPFSARNVALEGSSVLIERSLKQKAQSDGKVATVNAGVEFYIQTSSSELSKRVGEAVEDFDELYRRVQLQRLQRARK